MSRKIVRQVSIVPKDDIQDKLNKEKLHSKGYIYFVRSGTSSQSEFEFECSQEIVESLEIVEHKPVIDAHFVPNAGSENCVNALKTAEHVIERLGKHSRGNITEITELTWANELRAVTATWDFQLKRVGYANCGHSSCNFISSTMNQIKDHYKSCDGIPISDENVCLNCNRRLADSDMEAHLAVCSFRHKKLLRQFGESLTDSPVTTLPHIGDFLAQWEMQIKHLGYARCANNKCNFISLSMNVMAEHYGSCDGIPVFDKLVCRTCTRRLSENERGAHMAVCDGRTANNKKLRMYGTVTNRNTGSSSNNAPIIQPTPEMPKGTYMRRRCYNDCHKQAWSQKLETYHYIRCHFKNCSFLAMSIEDMALHYGLCIGGNDFAKFRCPVCKGCVTSQEVLDVHIARSHANSSDSPVQDTLEPEPSAVSEMSKLVNSSRTAFKQNGFVLCPKCSLICISVEEFCLHFSGCTGNKSKTTRVCNYCSGRTFNQKDLDLHVLSAHRNRELVYDVQSEARGPAILHYRNKGRMRKPAETFVPHSVNEDVKPEVETKLMEVEIPLQDDKTINSDLVENTANSDISNISNSLKSNALMSNTDVNPITMDCKFLEETTEQPVTHNSNDFDIKSIIDQKLSETKLLIETIEATQARHFDCVRSSKRVRKPVRRLSSESEPEIVKVKEKPKCQVKTKKTGRKRSCSESSDDEPIAQLKIKKTDVGGKLAGKNVCAKCKENVSRTNWKTHNAKFHTGLSWYEGETPVDIHALSKPELITILRHAFKISSKAVCEICNVTKRSFIGFYSHIMQCGRSDVEIEQMMITCDKCGRSFLPVSLYAHTRIHEQEEKAQKEKEEEEKASSNLQLPRKRQSALKAMSHFQDVLEKDSKTYGFYQKGEEIFDINFLNTVDCPRLDCLVKLPKSRNLRIDHILNCPTLPEKYYQCLSCPTFFLEETEAQKHSHNKGDEADDYQKSSEDEPELSEADVTDDEPAPIKETSETNTICHLRCRQSFQHDNQIQHRYGGEFHKRAFELELIAQRAALSKLEPYAEFGTEAGDWEVVDEIYLKNYLPPLSQSLPLKYGNSAFEYLKLFNASNIPGFNSFFVGGVIQNLAWCPISINRESTTRQLLALSVSNETDYYPSIFKGQTKSTLLQIWDVGDLAHEREDEIKPFFLLGIALDFGELWDFTWSPTDTFAPESGNHVERLGLLALAFNDGIVRVYSIARMEKPGSSRLPIYRVHPHVMLKMKSFTGNTQEPSCLNVSWGAGGVICAGFRSGFVSVWNLNQFSRRIVESKTTFSLYPFCIFSAFAKPITGIAICPRDPSYLVTSGSDRKLKMWDLRAPSLPIRTEYCSVAQKFYWMRNWPGLYYLDTGNEVALDFPPRFRYDQIPRFRSLSTIKDLTFSEWLCTTAISNESGEVIVRFDIDPLFDRYKKLLKNTRRPRALTTIATKCVQTSNEIFTSYSEIEQSGTGLFFEDFAFNKQSAMSQPLHCAAYSAGIPEKIAFNPNYRRFNHLAIGYRSGVVRILRLKHWQRTIDELIQNADNES